MKKYILFILLLCFSCGIKEGYVSKKWVESDFYSTYKREIQESYLVPVTSYIDGRVSIRMATRWRGTGRYRYYVTYDTTDYIVVITNWNKKRTKKLSNKIYVQENTYSNLTEEDFISVDEETKYLYKFSPDRNKTWEVEREEWMKYRRM